MFLFHLIFWVSKKVSGFGLVKDIEEAERINKHGKQFFLQEDISLRISPGNKYY